MAWRLRAEHPATMGRRACLLDLADGQTVESVLLPRDGVCVSTQVGCAVGCRFCMTGRSGLLRQLGSAEIVAQVVLARRRRKVAKVVFMGMGEPAHNMDNVLEAIELLGTAGGIGHKNLVFSTVGDRRVFERLPQGKVKPALALSLHTTVPSCARNCCPGRRTSLRRNWWNSPTPTRAPPAIRCNTNGHCSKASTTATTNWTPSCACSRASTR
jgi:23S rRNA (adenine2503-C2)-methyltransferase